MLRSHDGLSCHEVLERLEAWIDGDLDDGLAGRIRRHLDVCPSCQSEVHLAEQVRGSLRDLPELEPPQHLFDAVWTAVDSPSNGVMTAGWFSRLTARPIPVVAMVAAVVLLVFVVFPQREPDALRPGDEEVQRVTAETRLALAYLGSAARRGETRLKARLNQGQAVTTTVDGILKTLSWARGAAVAPTPRHSDEGSL